MRRIFTLVCSMAMVGGLGIGERPAVAASGDAGRIVSTAAHRYCPDTRCGAPRSVPTDTWVPVWCWRDAGSAGGTNRWFRVRYGGVDGWVSAAAMDPQPSVPYCSDHLANETLFANQVVWSGNGAYRLIMQPDGNLVLYSGSSALWASRTTGASGARAVMQPDGNFVIYDSANRPVWFTGTSNGGARLVVQSDSNVVLYTGSTPLYATSWHRAVGQSRAGNGFDWGWCTWYAAERYKNYSGYFPNIWGDAHRWNDDAAARGFQVQTHPTSHAVVVFEPSGPGSLGHVAWVNGVQLRADGFWIHVAEMNYQGFGVVSQRWVKHGAGMSYIGARSL